MNEKDGTYTGKLTVKVDADPATAGNQPLEALTAAPAGVTIEADKDIVNNSVEIYAGEVKDAKKVTTTYFDWTRNSAKKLTLDVKNTIPAGDYIVVWKNGGEDHKATFTVDKKTVTVSTNKTQDVSASAATYVIEVANADIAKYIAENATAKVSVARAGSNEFVEMNVTSVKQGANPYTSFVEIRFTTKDVTAYPIEARGTAKLTLTVDNLKIDEQTAAIIDF